jgi:signal transduction histidine kinase
MLAEQHDGQVFAESKQPAGATLCVVLPYTETGVLDKAVPQVMG